MAVSGAGSEPGAVEAPEGTTEAPEAGGTPEPAAAPSRESAPSPQPGPGPWSQDLERFPEEVRGDLDAYIRETWQPRVTQLEQSVLPEGQRQFWSDFQEDPDQTLLALVEEAYDPEIAQLVQVALQYGLDGEFPEEPGQPEQGERDEGQPEYAQLPPEQAELLESWQAEHEDQEYQQALNAVREAHPDHFPQDWSDETLADVLTPFVLAAPDDLDDDQVMEHAFQTYSKAYQLINGGQPGTEGAAAEAAANMTPEQIAAINAQAEGVPTVAGGQPGTGQAEVQYDNLGDAVKAFAAEMKAKHQPAPPTV